MPWLRRKAGERHRTGNARARLFVAPGDPVGLAVLAAAANQARLERRVVQHRFVDIQHHRRLADRSGARGRAGQRVPVRIVQRAKQLRLRVTVGLQVDQVVLDRGLPPGERVEVIVRRR